MNTSLGKRGPERLGSLLTSVFENLGLSEIEDEVSLRNHWQTVVGGQMAVKMEIQKLAQGRLYVKVVDPAWKMHLHLNKKDVLEHIHAFMGNKTVKDLILQ